MKTRDKLLKDIENGFGIKVVGNEKLDFTGIKSAQDQERKKWKKGFMG